MQNTPDESDLLNEDKHLLEQGRRRLALPEAVSQVSTSLRAARSLKDMLRILADETSIMLDAAAVTVWLYNSSKDELYQAAASGFPNMALRLKPGEGIAGQVFLSGEAHISRDFKNDPRTHESARVQVRAGLAGAAVPIRTDKQTVGVFFASVVSPRELTDDQVRLLNILADLAGVAIHRMQQHEMTELRLQRLATLRLVDAAMNACLDLETVLEILLDQVVSQLNVDAAAVFLISPTTHLLEFAAGRGLTIAEPDLRELSQPNSLADRAVQARQIVHVSELSTEPQMHSLTEQDLFVSGLAIPLITGNRILGVLDIFQRMRFDPDREWLDWLDMLAHQAGLAIDHALQFQDLQHANAELTSTVDAIVGTWGRALDILENEPEGHLDRLADITVQLARAMGLHDEELLHVRRGALLHDVGMLLIPGRVQFKREPLTDLDLQVLRRHPFFALNLFQSVPDLRPALEIPYGHHEKWDGTGYPNRLRESSIPIAARVFAVVDVWDALQSSRIYRAAYPEAKAREMIGQLSGTHFDPKVVATFLGMEVLT